MIMRLLPNQTARALVLAALAVFAATAAYAKDSMLLVIGNGPHAGTFKLEEGKGQALICGSFPGNPQLSAVWKDISAALSGKAPPNKLTSVGFNIFNPGDAGAKKGGIIVIFGGGGKKATTYQVMVPADSKGPLNMKKNGKALALSFDGKTKDGIALQVKVDCVM
jgi:hypothetical protein